MDLDAPHTTTIRVRYGETDRMGAVYYANYLAYFEVGRTEQLRAAGVRYRDLEEEGFRLAVVEAGVRYLSPARYDELITVTARLAARTTVRLRHEYEVRGEDGRRVAEGYTVLACLDDTGRPVRLPARLTG